MFALFTFLLCYGEVILRFFAANCITWWQKSYRQSDNALIWVSWCLRWLFLIRKCLIVVWCSHLYQFIPVRCQLYWKHRVSSAEPLYSNNMYLFMYILWHILFKIAHMYIWGRWFFPKILASLLFLLSPVSLCSLLFLSRHLCVILILPSQVFVCPLVLVLVS